MLATELCFQKLIAEAAHPGGRRKPLPQAMEVQEVVSHLEHPPPIKLHREGVVPVPNVAVHLPHPWIGEDEQHGLVRCPPLIKFRREVGVAAGGGGVTRGAQHGARDGTFLFHIRW